MVTTIEVPANTIPKAWKLNIPRQQEMITLTVNLDDEILVGKTDPEVDAQIENGECISFNNINDSVDFFETLNQKLDNAAT